MADLIVLTPSISIEITNIPTPVAANTHQLSAVRYAKSCSQLYITHQATGNVIKNATMTSVKKSLDNSETICATVAPSTFRTPISFVRVLVIYMTRPNNPRQLIKMHRPADQFSNRDM